MQQRLKILFIPAWYPSEVNPISGTFVREHAKAASLHNEVVVLYAYPDPAPHPRGLYRLSEDIEYGIRTIRVRYGGLLVCAKRRAFKAFSKPPQNQGDVAKNDSTNSPRLSVLNKVLKTLFLVTGDLLYYWSIISVFRKLAREGWRPDIIHAHVFTAGVPAVILGSLYRTSVVITEHWTGFTRRSLTRLDRLKARFALNKADIVLPVSNALKEAIEAYGIANTFHVIPNVVDTQLFALLSPQTRPHGSQSKRILLAAILTQQKGVPHLLQALTDTKAKRSDFVLDIVGDGPNRADYQRLAAKLELNDVVRFHGLKPKGEVARFMQECDFFVQPSLWETFGVVYIEAMACGKPVIGSGLPVLKEIVNDDVGLLVPPGDVKALAHAIEYMLDNCHNYSAERIAQYAKQRFGCDAVGRRLDTVYRALIRRVS